MSELTEQERKFVALALQGLAMRASRSDAAECFETVLTIARKLDCETELMEYAQSWIDHATLVVEERQRRQPGRN